jgi:hypothetical protein
MTSAVAAAPISVPAPPSPDGALAGPAAPHPYLYVVLFEVASDEAGKVATLAVSGVIDPQKSKTERIKFDVPDEFLAASRQQLLKRDYPPNKHFFTYGFLDPKRPGKADIDPANDRF